LSREGGAAQAAQAASRFSVATPRFDGSEYEDMKFPLLRSARSGGPAARAAELGAGGPRGQRALDWAAGAAGSNEHLDQQALTARLMLKVLDQVGDESGDGLGTVGKSLRRLHKLQGMVKSQPEKVIRDYLEELMNRMGIEPGEPWQIYHFDKQIAWWKLKGLQRCHVHASHVLGLLLRDQSLEAAAYLVQYLKALHQVVLDQGSWENASLLLPRQDPISQVEYGGLPAELETAASYRDSLKKLNEKQRAAAKGGEKGGEQ
jgi:hypothetical protein